MPFLSARESDYDTLADVALETLCAMVEYKAPAERTVASLVSSSEPLKGIIAYLELMWKEVVHPEVLAVNEFQRLLGRLEGLPNYKALYAGLSRVLSNFVTTKNSSLPNSIKELKCFDELTILLLRLITYNPVFSAQIQ